jgi:hypothetical protein
VGRPLDRALFLLGETTLTVEEIVRWAAELTYPAKVPALDLGKQLIVARADVAEGWRG